MTLVESGPFEAACRRMLDAPPEALITAEFNGPTEVQIGDYTWDTEPGEIVIEAWIPGIDSRSRDHLRQYRGKVWKRTFRTLPDLWEALHDESPTT